MKRCDRARCDVSNYIRIYSDYKNYREYYEKTLIIHCSPTLAGIKSASMFTVKYEYLEDLIGEIDHMNHLCLTKDLKCRLLKIGNGNCLVYVYREKMLHETLTSKSVQNFLREKGYPIGDLEEMLNHLAVRMNDREGFPHEIGIFLDYPFEDVIGFIENTGQNCLMCGYWKVYNNEQQAKTIFDLYDACKEKYIQLFLGGTSLFQLVSTI